MVEDNVISAVTADVLSAVAHHRFERMRGNICFDHSPLIPFRTDKHARFIRSLPGRQSTICWKFARAAATAAVSRTKGTNIKPDMAGSSGCFVRLRENRVTVKLRVAHTCSRTRACSAIPQLSLVCISSLPIEVKLRLRKSVLWLPIVASRCLSSVPWNFGPRHVWSQSLNRTMEFRIISPTALHTGLPLLDFPSPRSGTSSPCRLAVGNGKRASRCYHRRNPSESYLYWPFH